MNSAMSACKKGELWYPAVQLMQSALQSCLERALRAPELAEVRSAPA